MRNGELGRPFGSTGGRSEPGLSTNSNGSADVIARKAHSAFFGGRTDQLKRLDPPFVRSPALLVITYCAAAALYTLLLSRIPCSVAQFGLLSLSGRTKMLCLESAALVSSTGLLIFWLAKRLLAAAEEADSALTQKDVAVSAIDILGEAVLVADITKEGAPIIYANQAFEELTGHSAADARGKSCSYLQGNDRLQPEMA